MPEPVQKGALRDDDMDLSSPVAIRAEMARNGFAPGQMALYWSPDTERRIDPLANAEARQDVRRFMDRLWRACLVAEGR